VRPTLACVTAVGLIAAGCATYVWQRPGTPVQVMQRDEQDCDSQAHQIAVYYDVAGDSWLMSPYSADPFYRPMGFETGLTFERRIARHCMEAKGYRLMKQPPPGDGG
jgi:hypothetical protein